MSEAGTDELDTVGDTGTALGDDEPADDVIGPRVAWYLAAAMPFVVAVIRAIRNDWFPIGDSALLYLRTADVGTTHHPWLGSWSSASLSLGFDVNNAGPIYADLIAPFAHLFEPGIGNAIGVASVSLACLVGAGIAAHRIGGRMFEAWVLAAGALLAWVMGSELLFDIFQGHALLFPMLDTLVLLVGMMNGHGWVWPWLVGLLSLILQTHVSYAYILTLVVASSLALTIWQLEAPRRATVVAAMRSRTAAISAIVVGVAWLQPVLEQIFGEGEGNMSRLARAAAGTDVNVGFENAVGLTAAITSLPPFWTRWGFAGTIEPAFAVETPDGVEVVISWLPATWISVLSLLLTLGLLALTHRYARRNNHVVLLALSRLSLIATVSTVIALSRLTIGAVGLAPHHTRWVFVIALMNHVTMLWALTRAAADRMVGRNPGWRRLPAATAGVALLVAGMANLPAYAQQHGPTADADAMPALRRLFAGLGPLADDAPVLYRTDNVRIFEPYSSAIHLELQNQGIEFRVIDEGLVRQLGNGRRADGSERSVVAQFERWEALREPDDGCLLVRASELTPGADAEMEAAAHDLVTAVAAASFDVAGVYTADGALDVDHMLATRFDAGDREATEQIVVDGRLRFWLEHGWATGDGEVVARLHDEGPQLTEWVDSLVALVVTPASVCDRSTGL